MSASRNTIMNALATRLQGAAPWGVVSRRNRAPSSVAAVNQPALLLLRHSEHYAARGPNMPSVRMINVFAAVYIDTGTDETAIPDAIVADLQDAVDAALAADVPQGYCTLGGLVQSAKIAGTVTLAPGDVTGKGLALIPIEIILP